MCEDPACDNKERAVNLRLEKGYIPCKCDQGVMIREYADSDLHKLLNSLLYVFDVNKGIDELGDKGTIINNH